MITTEIRGREAENRARLAAEETLKRVQSEKDAKEAELAAEKEKVSASLLWHCAVALTWVPAVLGPRAAKED